MVFYWVINRTFSVNFDKVLSTDKMNDKIKDKKYLIKKMCLKKGIKFMIVLEEFDMNNVAVINPSDIVAKKEDFPEVAIACYSKILFDKIVDKCNGKLIGELSNTVGKKLIYEIEYNNKTLVIFNIGAGAPMAATDIEDIHEMGANKFVIFGNCGVLDKDIEDCSIIIPIEAIRDEGTSYHYMVPSRTIKINEKYIDIFTSLLDNFGYSYTTGTTWTTDAFYRETRDKVERRKNEGAKVVEMEASAIQAVCNFREIDLLTFFYAGDNLDIPNWDKRSLAGDIKLDQKMGVAMLALEMASKM